MSEWLDIKTAPKDGTSILASDGARVRIMFWRSSVERWGWHGAASVRDEKAQQPTHWMPLPPNP